MSTTKSFEEFLSTNKQWNELVDERNKFRSQMKNRGKADSMLHRASSYFSAARLIETNVLHKWECDCSDEEVNTVQKWTGTSMQIHVEYMQDVVHHLALLAAAKGKEADDMICEIDQAKVHADKLQDQIHELHGQLSEQYNQSNK